MSNDLGLIQTVKTSQLSVAYHRLGRPDGQSVILLHGFPYAPDGYSLVAHELAAHGCDVIVPFLRGFGPTQFLKEHTPRSGQQASLGLDLHELIQALSLKPAILAGYDWGGRAACIVAALWPEQVRGLVSCGGYNIQDIAKAASRPADPVDEHKYWYQYYLHGERGRAGLRQNRQAFCQLLWKQWSPGWAFDQATFQRSAQAFENPDFVEVVVHSYRHRYGLVAGDPAGETAEAALSGKPAITVPTVTIEGLADMVLPGAGYGGAQTLFSQLVENVQIENAGHNPPQETPADFIRALTQLM